MTPPNCEDRLQSLIFFPFAALPAQLSGQAQKIPAYYREFNFAECHRSTLKNSPAPSRSDFPTGRSPT
jgi:hypothetical protein